MKDSKSRSLVAFLMVVLTAMSMFAEDWANSSVGSKSYRNDTTIYVSGTNQITGRLTINSGVSVTIVPKEDAGDVVIKRNYNGDGLFYLNRNSKFEDVGN